MATLELLEGRSPDSHYIAVQAIEDDFSTDEAYVVKDRLEEKRTVVALYHRHDCIEFGFHGGNECKNGNPREDVIAVLEASGHTVKPLSEIIALEGTASVFSTYRQKTKSHKKKKL